jgi:hypothetical protein
MQQSMAQLEATTSQGVATIETLRGQREKLERTQDKLKVAGGNIDVSHQVLKRMQKRAFTNKLIRYATIGILIIGAHCSSPMRANEQTSAAAPLALPVAGVAAAARALC